MYRSRLFISDSYRHWKWLSCPSLIKSKLHKVEGHCKTSHQIQILAKLISPSNTRIRAEHAILYTTFILLMTITQHTCALSATTTLSTSLPSKVAIFIQMRFECHSYDIQLHAVSQKTDRGWKNVKGVCPGRLWNSLPLNCRTAPSVNIFKIRHKTFLFDSA